MDRFQIPDEGADPVPVCIDCTWSAGEADGAEVSINYSPKVFFLWSRRRTRTPIDLGKIDFGKKDFLWHLCPLPAGDVSKESTNRRDVAPSGCGAERATLSARQ